MLVATQIQKILIVEDSSVVTKVLRHLVKADPLIEAHFASDFAQAKQLVEQHSDFVAALTDLNLPDAPAGEVVDLVLGKQIPTIVLTGSYDEEKRESLLAKGIVDYVTKDGRYSYRYALNLVHRLHRNQQIKVLVVEDSSTSRKFICSLLECHQYQVLSAGDGVEAIKVLLANPDIRLLITDYHMPNMDGFELVQNIRVKYEKSDLVVIGLSGESEGSLSAKFIKNGANDFLHKPFNHEEFYCRVTQNIESMELIERIRDSANRDPLTHVYSRHYFFSVAESKWDQAQTASTPLSLAVIDVDDLNGYNEQLGHEQGDQLLRGVGALLNQALSRFTVARSSGGEFLVLLPGLAAEKALSLLEQVRILISSSPIELDGGAVHASVSIGVSGQLRESFQQMLTAATEGVQRAKDAGRNLVVGDD